MTTVIEVWVEQPFRPCLAKCPHCSHRRLTAYKGRFLSWERALEEIPSGRRLHVRYCYYERRAKARVVRVRAEFRGKINAR